MNDLLIDYQKGVSKSRPLHDNPSQAELYECSHYKRCAAYTSYQHTIASCSNQTTCQVLEAKLNDYSCYIDDRKGVNNFASLLKSLASNASNVSKKWLSGLSKTLPNLLMDDMLKSEESTCENPSTNGCTAAVPSSDHLTQFWTTLSNYKRESNQQSIANSNTASISYNQVDNGNKKKTSLYATYEDSYLDQLKSEMRSNAVEVKGVANTNSRFAKSSVQSTLPYSTSKSSHIDSHKIPNNRNLQHEGLEVMDARSFQNKSSTGRIKKLNKFLKEDEEDEIKQMDYFKTASETMKLQNQNRHGSGANRFGSHSNQTVVKKSLGGKGRAASNRFVPPLRSSQEEGSDSLITRSVLGRSYGNSTGNGGGTSESADIVEDERLRHIDPKMVEMIRSEIMDHGSTITWDDIAGLDFAKHTIQEIVVWPMLRPDIFTGLRRPPKGILLFGPPGTGKTLIGKCIASQSKSTFFSISASSLTSKWIGDGEKMVRALFAVARVEQPAVVFIDEIDSLLSQRSDQEHESSRRIKTEFLVQLDGAATGEEDRLLIIGATNRPQELDEAARRRLVKRLYIPLPDCKARKQLVSNLMAKERNDLSEQDLEEVATLTDGYSGADMKNLCQEASLGPIRAISASLIASINPEQVRPVNVEDFKLALKRVRSSVSSSDLDLYINWDKQFGMSS